MPRIKANFQFWYWFWSVGHYATKQVIDSWKIFDKTGHSEEQPWEANGSKSHTTFPVGALLILLSFTIMLFLEETCGKNSNTDLKQSERIPIIILTKV